MAYAIAQGIGIPKTVLFSPNLASGRMRWTPAFLQVKWSTLWTLLYQQHSCHSPLVSTLTTLPIFIFPKKRKFEALLSLLITVEFMGTVKWFLGTHFQWLLMNDVISIHLSQTGFAAHLVEDNNIHTRNMTPNAAPYPSGLLINAIPKLDKADNCPTLIEQKWKYQCQIGSIGWLAQSTHPDLPPIHFFLLA